MKKIILFFSSILFISLSLQAQTPEKFNYQGIARNNNGDPMTTQNLGLRISILSGSSAVYIETHNVTTNNFGLYTLSVGGGVPVSGTINSVNWSSGNKHIKVEIDPNGGSNYSDLGTSELLSVPYAMYSATSGSGGSGDDWGSQAVEVDATLFGDGTSGDKLGIAQNGATDGQILQWDDTGSNWVPADGGAGTDGWTLDGNAAGSDDFIGTTNSEALRFKQDDQPAGFIKYSNTSYGYHSLSESSSGERNTAVGDSSLNSNTTGERNTAVGGNSLSDNTEGNNNTSLGSGALSSNTTGHRNTAIGSNSLLSSSSVDNTAIGAFSLNNNTTGYGNTAIGEGALLLNDTGDNNIAIGNSTFSSNTTGNSNTGIGSFADVSTDGLTNTTTIGANTLVAQDNSLILGSINGVNDATADTKVGIGTTTPEERLHVVGDELLEGWLTIKEDANDYSKIYFKNGNNDARWTLAGHPKTDEASSLFNFYFNDGTTGRDVMQVSGQGKVGVNYDPTGTTYEDGALAVRGINNENNISLINTYETDNWGFYISNSGKMKLYLNGAQKGTFDTNGAYSQSSDRRLKENIAATQSVLEKVQAIEIMNYTYKADNNRRPQIGYIAQELEKQFPEFVNKPDENSERKSYYTVNYAGMSTVAIKAIQEQQETIEAQAEELEEVHQQLDDLEARLLRLEKQ